MNLTKYRGEVARARNWAGRAGTAAGTIALAGALYTPNALPTAAPWAIGTTAIGVACLRPWRENTPGLVTALYISPTTALIAEMAVFRVVDGVHWAEAAAGAAWTGIVWWLRPSRLATELAGTAPTTGTPAVVARTPEARLAEFWNEHLATENGAAPHTHLENVRVTAGDDFAAEIVSDTVRPVPSVPIATLSRLFDMPEEQITIGPVPGRGAGRKQLTVNPPQTAVENGDTPGDGTDIYTRWEKYVATKAMPGARIVRIRRGNTQTGEFVE